MNQRTDTCPVCGRPSNPKGWAKTPFQEWAERTLPADLKMIPIPRALLEELAQADAETIHARLGVCLKTCSEFHEAQAEGGAK
jgi:hypothetical protein